MTPARRVPLSLRARSRRSGGDPLAFVTATIALALVACPRSEPTEPPEPAPEASKDAQPAPDEDPPPTDEPPACGSPGLAFSDHTWAPATATAIASIRLDDPELGASLDALATHARAPGHGLPIALAFSIGQWSWQIPTLRATIAAAGFRPAELVFVADERTTTWLWRSDCDVDRARDHVDHTWSLRSRKTVEGIVATPIAPVDPEAASFPWDVLVLSGDRVALAPAGQAATVLEHWSRPAPASLTGATAAPLGEQLDALASAPIRVVVRGRALVDAADDDPSPGRSLRVTADGVTDATLPDP